MDAIMREEVNKIVSIHKRHRYLISTVLFSLLFYSSYALMRNASILIEYSRSGEFLLVLNLIPSLVGTFNNTISTQGLFFAAFISFLVGINITIVLFRLSELSKIDRTTTSSLSGLIIAFVTPACSACATAVVGVAGSTSLFSILPFGGAIVRIISIALLLGSAYYVVKQIGKEICKV